MSGHEDLPEWVSFEDPKEKRTWMFDATYLKSNWMCIYGSGCKGILETDATELSQGCCSFGAHFIDDEDQQTVVKAVKRLKSKHWQHKKVAEKKGWSVKEKDGSIKTHVVDGACIFLNRPGFEGGAGCALHVAALEVGERPMDWKPDVCWQVPVRLEEHEGDDGHVISFVREWKRRDWGDAGDEFHWWCTDSPEAFVGTKPTYVYLRDEIVELCGEEVYTMLVELLAAPTTVTLPHPAVRR